MPGLVKFIIINAPIVIALSAVAISVGRSNNYNLSIIADNSLPEFQAESVEGRYLFGGTIVWGRNVEEWSKDDTGQLDPKYPFSGLASFEPDKYDAWGADLECPTSIEDIDYQTERTTLEFNCRQEFLPEAAKYFEFFNLANNHSNNSGQAKLDETRQVLTDYGIQYFGDPEPNNRDEICEVVALPVRVNYRADTLTKQENKLLPVAFCAWHYFYRLPVSGEIEELTKYSTKMPVFAFLHMGAEYEAVASQSQRDVARKIIDLGAEFVIANSPHWVQDGEVYNGKPIFYSTGNFIFDQQWSREVTSNLNVEVQIKIDYTSSLEPWLAMADTCRQHQDDCLEMAEELAIYKPEFSFDVVAGSNANKLQKRADAEIQAFVEDRVGWEQMKAQLSEIE